MSIKVRYFASLKDLMGRSEEEIIFVNRVSVKDVLIQVSENRNIPQNILAAINMEYVEFEAKVADGDEVAFFPPVTGG
jgi:molybdopterin synthase sulfur carrier subunit